MVRRINIRIMGGRMKTLKLIIMPDGRASTINPHGKEKPKCVESVIDCCFGLCAGDLWEHAEAQRKSYEVVCPNCHGEGYVFQCGVLSHGYDAVDCECQDMYKPGTMVEAEVIAENTVRVVKISES